MVVSIEEICSTYDRDGGESVRPGKIRLSLSTSQSQSIGMVGQIHSPFIEPVKDPSDPRLVAPLTYTK